MSFWVVEAPTKRVSVCWHRLVGGASGELPGLGGLWAELRGGCIYVDFWAAEAPTNRVGVCWHRLVGGASGE